MKNLRNEHKRLMGIQKAKDLNIYHNSKLKFTKYNKNLQNAFYEVLNRSSNHMSMENIADTNNMSRSTLYKKLKQYKPHLIKSKPVFTKSFSNWIGGKSRPAILNKLLAYLPKKYDPTKNTFYELFSGMASLSFAVRPTHLVLNDNNPLIANCFQVVKDNPNNLVETVKKMITNNSRSYYYKIRNLVNSTSTNDLLKASGLLYLVATSFNGFIRVNQSGKFNMAWGNGHCNQPNYKAIIKDSEYLNQVNLKLSSEDFEKVILCQNKLIVHKHDFVYLDPPYVKGYKLYGKHMFNLDDLIRLRNLCILLSFHHVYVMVSNYDTRLVRELFMGQPFYIHPIQLSQAVNSNGKARKRKFREVIITNYSN